MLFNHYICSCLTTVFSLFVLHSSQALSILNRPRHKLETEIKHILDRHNQYRTCHHAPPLIVDPQLTKDAQNLATALAREQINLDQARRWRHGNLFITQGLQSDDLFAMNTNSKFSFNPVDKWYNEVKFYYNDRSKTDHFSRIVWKDTKKLGVGIAQNEKGFLYIVCKYDPDGNIPGLYDKNVIIPDVKMVHATDICVVPPLTSPYKKKSTASSKLLPVTAASDFKITSTYGQHSSTSYDHPASSFPTSTTDIFESLPQGLTTSTSMPTQVSTQGLSTSSDSSFDIPAQISTTESGCSTTDNTHLGSVLWNRITTPTPGVSIGVSSFPTFTAGTSTIGVSSIPTTTPGISIGPSFPTFAAGTSTIGVSSFPTTKSGISIGSFPTTSPDISIGSFPTTTSDISIGSYPTTTSDISIGSYPTTTPGISIGSFPTTTPDISIGPFPTTTPDISIGPFPTTTPGIFIGSFPTSTTPVSLHDLLIPTTDSAHPSTPHATQLYNPFDLSTPSSIDIFPTFSSLPESKPEEFSTAAPRTSTIFTLEPSTSTKPEFKDRLCNSSDHSGNLPCILPEDEATISTSSKRTDWLDPPSHEYDNQTDDFSPFGKQEKAEYLKFTLLLMGLLVASMSAAISLLAVFAIFKLFVCCRRARNTLDAPSTPAAQTPSNLVSVIPTTNPRPISPTLSRPASPVFQRSAMSAKLY